MIKVPSTSWVAALIATLILSGPSLAWLPPARSTTYSLVFFLQPGSATLDARAIEHLKRIASDASGRFDGPIRLTGHADTEEADVSRTRVEAVRAKLVELGVAPARMSVAWRGSQVRLVLRPPGTPEVQNRRVEVNLERQCWSTRSCPLESD